MAIIAAVEITSTKAPTGRWMFMFVRRSIRSTALHRFYTMELIFVKDSKATILSFENMDISEAYNCRINNPLYNTSYPLRPSDWRPYLVDEPLAFGQEDLAFYIHIPFCRSLCSFCEYTRVRIPDEECQLRYVRKLSDEVRTFMGLHKCCRLLGLDVGGGTPTALSVSAFTMLMSLCKNVFFEMGLTDDFEPSIEGTFSTITYEKLLTMTDAGFHRLSLGVQSSNVAVLSRSNRNATDTKDMECVIQMARDAGIRKINLDFMYGLAHQTTQSLAHDLALVQRLHPEQVTLYELRTNMTHESSHTTSDERFDMYASLYDGLHKIGYHAPFGQNTFSLCPSDMGTSSYIRHRMRDCAPYKGFGLSAQSMSPMGIAYNVGKNSSNERLYSLLDSTSYAEEFTYRLPPREIASKYIAIAAYSGSFSLSRLSSILGGDSRVVYARQIDFCLGNDLMTRCGDQLRITPKGFRHYGAVFSLFYDIQDLTI